MEVFAHLLEVSFKRCNISSDGVQFVSDFLLLLPLSFPLLLKNASRRFCHRMNSATPDRRILYDAPFDRHQEMKHGQVSNGNQSPILDTELLRHCFALTRQERCQLRPAREAPRNQEHNPHAHLFFSHRRPILSNSEIVCARCLIRSASSCIITRSNVSPKTEIRRLRRTIAASRT